MNAETAVLIANQTAPEGEYNVLLMRNRMDNAILDRAAQGYRSASLDFEVENSDTFEDLMDLVVALEKDGYFSLIESVDHGTAKVTVRF